MDLTIKILNRLALGIAPSAIQLNVSSKDLNAKLEEMKETGLIDFDYIKNHPVFEGDPDNIKLTDKGREEAEKHKHKGI